MSTPEGDATGENSTDSPDQSPLRWSVLSRISEIAVLNAGYIAAAVIPVAAAILIQINSLFETDFVFGSNLFIAYVASLALAVAKLSYSLLCPKIIRYYNNFNRYLSELDDLVRSVTALGDARGPINERKVREEVENLTSRMDLTEDQRAIVSEHLAKVRQGLDAAATEKKLATIVQNYEARWDEAEFKRPRWRIAIFTLYVGSGAAAAYLFFGVGLWRVVRLAFF